MTGFAKVVSRPMPKATSIVILAGCLLLGVLVGMSPMYTDGSGSRPTNLRATGASTEVAPAPKQQHESSNSKMPSRLADAQLFRVSPQDLAVKNADETGGAESKVVEPQGFAAGASGSPEPLNENPEPFFWGDNFPNYEDLDLDQFTVPVEESLAYIDASNSYDFVGLDVVGLSASSPLSLSYEF